MNAKKVKVILEKINHQLPVFEAHKSNLDKDIILGYIRQLYDSVLEDETIVEKALRAPSLFEMKEPDETFFDDKKMGNDDNKILPKTITINTVEKLSNTNNIDEILVTKTSIEELQHQDIVEEKHVELEIQNEPKTSIAERILSELKGLSKSEINNISESPEIKNIIVESERTAQNDSPQEVNFADIISKTQEHSNFEVKHNYQFTNENILHFFNEKIEDYGDVASQLANKKLNDLREGMAIYQRYEFVQELFKGDNVLFDSVLRKVNSTNEKSEALEIIDVAVGKIELNTPREEVLKKFVQFVRRKF